MKAQLCEVGTKDNPKTRIVWYCPGCKGDHGVPVPPHANAWQWNGSLNAPTLSPSVLVKYPGSDAGKDGAPPAVCHCFVRDGRIEFLGDCSHDQAGNTVEMREET